MLDINAIILKMKKGETDLFREIIMEYAPALRAFIGSRLYANDIIEDLMQDTFLAAYENISNYDKEQKFIHWLIGIASNKIKNYYRSNKIQKSAYEKMADIISLRKNEIEHNTNEIYLHQNKRLHNCIEELPEKARHLIKARYFDNIQVKQIAQFQKSTELAVSALLFRTRQKLAECMERIES